MNETKDEKKPDEKRQGDASPGDEARGDPDQVYRTLGDMLRFWKFCKHGQCKRAQRCSGPVKPCFRYFWPQVPDDIKNEIRFSMKLRLAGASPADAVRGAREELARWKKTEAATAARFASAATITRKQLSPPRVRSM